jgi:phage gp36-like protein
MAFITSADYSVLIRNEIKDILLENYTENRLHDAEKMGISQVRKRLAGRYDVAKIFSEEGEKRDAYVVMIVLDCTLYHLYTATVPNKMPTIRSERYQDALDWLKSVAKGEEDTDLPKIQDEDGNNLDGIKISSKYLPNNNRW